MKRDKRKWWLFLLIPLVIITLGIIVIQLVTAGEKDKIQLTGQSFNQLRLTEGQVEGSFRQSVVSVKVKLNITNNKVKSIDLLEHTTGLGKKAETIIDTVIEQQRTDVDTISGATLSSKVILKAIENAIEQ